MLKALERRLDFTTRMMRYFKGNRLVKESPMPPFMPLIPGWPRVMDAKGKALPLSELLTQRESQVLEFKSSFQWGVQENRPNKHIRKAPPRAVAGFMNADGGVLLIGVEDNRAIFGLEKDYGLLKGDEKIFEQTLLKLCADVLDPFDPSLVHIRFEKIEGKSVAVVRVYAASEPVWMMWKQEKPKLYVRFGNTTQTLTTKQADMYIKAQWNSG